MSERLDRFSTPSSGQLTVIASIGVSALNDYIRDHVWHKHSGLEVDGIGARRNANCLEFAPYAIITDTPGFSFARYEMQLHALATHYPEPHWHAAIMLLRQGRMRRFVINCDLPLI